MLLLLFCSGKCMWSKHKGFTLLRLPDKAFIQSVIIHSHMFWRAIAVGHCPGCSTTASCRHCLLHSKYPISLSCTYMHEVKSSWFSWKFVVHISMYCSNNTSGSAYAWMTKWCLAIATNFIFMLVSFFLHTCTSSWREICSLECNAPATAAAARWEQTCRETTSYTE